MKLITQLEKNKTVWFLIGFCLLFFFLRFPSIIEPYWYGDEGVYEVIGQAMDHGRLLYRDIWDNKPPLLYIVYALAQGDQGTVKIISLIAGIFSLIIFFLLSKKLFRKQWISILTTAIYTILLGTPLLEGDIANAEVFILPFTISAGLLMYQLANKNKAERHGTLLFVIAGFLLGIAFLFKIVAIFDFAAFFLFLLILKLPEKISLSVSKKSLTKENSLFRGTYFLLIGFLLPVVVTISYFVLNNALQNFFQAVFSGNISYVGWGNTLLGFPLGLLIIKLLILITGTAIIIWRRRHLSKPTIFISLWILFSLFNAFFSERPYTHYVIVLLPSFCLFIGLFFQAQKIKSRTIIAVLFAAILTLVCLQFQFNVTKSYMYYPNAIQFITGHESVTAYQSFFDPKTPRNYALASFITHHTTSSDHVFIWGNSPQIYVLSHKLPIGKYTVAYHIIQNNAVAQTQQQINQQKPKYIIALNGTQLLPFALPLYIMRYNIPGASIYERSL